MPRFLTIALIMTSFAVSFAAWPARSDDTSLGDKLAPVGESIKKGAQDTGAAIEKAAKDVGSTIEEKTQPVGDSVKKSAQDTGPKIEQGAKDTGAKIEQGAKDTGSWLDQSTKDFRDGAQSFFQKVGNFFSGSSSSK